MSCLTYSDDRYTLPKNYVQVWKSVTKKKKKEFQLIWANTHTHALLFFLLNYTAAPLSLSLWALKKSADPNY